MKEEFIKKQRKLRREKRVRQKILQNKAKPRLTVFRSNKHIYAQIIDDNKGKTLISASEAELKKEKLTKMEKAQELGKIIAGKATTKKIKEVVFDKGAYKYHGRIKVLVEAAREGGLVF